ncbi:MAG: PAS domain S-box protein [Crocosphaera sp.]|nr:PAS domain S-box protein [Crocosphaera sp.]
MKNFIDLLNNLQIYLNLFTKDVIYLITITLLIFIIIILIFWEFSGQSPNLKQLKNKLQEEIIERQKIEKKFTAIFNQTFQFIGLLDLEGTLLEANESALNCVGLPAEDVIGKPFWETPWWSHSSQCQTQLKTAIKEARQGKIVRFETIHFDQNNQKVYVDFSLKPVRDEKGKIIFLIPEGRDITTLKKAEKNLKENQQELEAIFDLFPDLFLRMKSNSIILEYRGSPRSNFYVSSEVLLGKSMLEILPNAVSQKWEKAISYVLKFNTLVYLEYSLPIAKGEEYYEARLVPFGKKEIIAIVRNISQAKQAELELIKSKIFLQTIIDYLPVAIFVKDGKPEKFGQLLLVNKACEDIFGLYSSQVIGKTGYDLFPLEQAEFYEKKDQQAFRKGVPEHIPEETIDSYNKGRRIVRTVKVPLYDDHNNPKYLVCITEDITQQKQAEQEKEASENKLKALLKYSSDIVSIFDREGKLIYNSPAAQKIHGFSPEEMLQQNTFNFMYPDDRARVEAKFFQLLNNPQETVTVQYRYQKKGDDYVWMEAVASNQLDDPNIQGIVANSRDISQRKQAEEALRESEQKFRQLAENIHEVFWIIELSQTDPSYHKSLYVSPAYKDVWSYNPEELYNNPMQWLEAIHPDDQEQIKQGLSQKLLKGEFDYQYRIIRPDGTLRWIRDRGFPVKNQTGELIRVTGLAEDITAQKETEREIKRLNEELTAQNQQLEERVAQRTAELETLLNTLPDFVFVVERNTMKLLFCNQVFAQRFGFDQRQQMEGKSIFECFPAEIADYFAQQNQQVFNSGETLHLEETVSLADGDRYFDTYKVPLKNSQGHIYALLGTSRDITELVRTKGVLMERTTQLEDANQELDSFCYSVSHDLRAPLRHIKGFVNALQQRLLGSDVIEDAKVIHYLEVIEKSSEKMAHLIDGLLTLSRVGRRELVFHEVNLNSVVETAISMVSFKDQTIDFKIGKLPIVSGDSALLQQVFINLLHNSIKFSQGRDPIEIEINTSEDGTIFVADNGVGFDVQYADQLFGAFQRLHSQKDFEGTGIGLSIVQRIIHRHGGRIWAESVLGEGATFYLKLS